MNTKELTKLKKNLREKVKEKHCKVSIARDYSCITTEYVNDWDQSVKMMISAKKVNGVLTISTHSGYEQDSLSLVLEEFWLPYAKAMQLDAVFVRINNSILVKELKTKGFAVVKEVIQNDQWKLHVDSNIHSDMPVYVINQQNLFKTIKLNQTLTELLEKKKKEDITFSYDLKCVNQNELQLSYYYQGARGAFKYELLNGKLTIQAEKGDVLLESAAELETWLTKHFQSVYDRQKLKNIFDYPKAHFEHYIRNKNCCNPKVGEEILKYLRMKYKPKEIEEHFAANEKNPVLNHYRTWSGKITKITVLMDCFFIITSDDQLYCFAQGEKEQAKEKYTEAVFKETEKDVQQQLMNFEKSIEKRLQKDA